MMTARRRAILNARLDRARGTTRPVLMRISELEELMPEFRPRPKRPSPWSKFMGTLYALEDARPA
jgi:hypothetical protein